MIVCVIVTLLGVKLTPAADKVIVGAALRVDQIKINESDITVVT